MKHTIKTIAMGLVTIGLVSTMLISCTKKTADPVVVDQLVLPQAQSSVPVKVNFDGVFAKTECVTGRGVCCSALANVSELEALTLATNEGKGIAWSRKLADGSVVTTLSLLTTNLSELMLEELLVSKTMTISQDCTIPNTLLEACYKTDKIALPSNVSCVIPKGKHPVTLLSNQTSLVKPVEITLQITMSAKNEYVGHVTLLR